MFTSLDDFLRNIFSYVFRFIILTYSIILIDYSTNKFKLYWYLLFILTYPAIFYYFKKYKKSGLGRLINDCGFIFLVLWGKELSSSINYFLILLLLINSQNHSGSRINFYNYLIIIPEVIILSYKDFSWLLLLPIALIFIIDAFIRLRNSLRSINESLFEIIDSFYAKSAGRRESHLIYNHLMRSLSQNRFLKKLKIDFISAFIIKNGDLILVNSSMSIVDFKIEDTELLKKELSEREIFTGSFVTVNGVLYKTNFFAKVKGNARIYIFLISLNQNKTSLYRKFYSIFIMKHLLFPTLKHLARVFEAQHQISLTKYRGLDTISKNQDYILKANEVMHFVKNCLSPIKSALTISTLYFEQQDVDKKEYLKENFIKQRRQALMEINNISDRANFILAKSKNPFESTNIYKQNLYSVLSNIRQKWSELFNINSFFVYNEFDVNLIEKKCLFDDDTLYLIISNIIANMNVHGEGEKTCSFIVNMDFITLAFQNEISLNSQEYEKLKKLAHNFNENNRIEINKRTSHGLAHLKLYSESINAGTRIDIQNRKFVFNLIIPIVL